MTHWLVLPSPFLGPSAYAPLADALRTGGDDASVAAYAEPPDAADLVAGWSATAGRIEDVVLVPHSNAGHLAPLVSDRCGGLSIVFMDAALPAPSGSSPLVPTALRSHLVGLAHDGMLPVWTRWWSRADLDDVVPGPWFDRIDATAPRVPLAYAEDAVGVPDGWEHGRCAYLAFGETYAEELARVREMGWPHRIVAGRHLQCVVAPHEAASGLRALRGELAGR
ncbi:MAG: hypothetical protein ACXWXO_15355 [Nocardioides sp.]